MSELTRTHKLKTWPSYFGGLVNQAKTAEVRDMTDREFRPGDKLILEEYIPGNSGYTGQYQFRTISRVDDLRPFMNVEHPVLLSFADETGDLKAQINELIGVLVQIRSENEGTWKEIENDVLAQKALNIECLTCNALDKLPTTLIETYRKEREAMTIAKEKAKHVKAFNARHESTCRCIDCRFCQAVSQLQEKA